MDDEVTPFLAAYKAGYHVDMPAEAWQRLWGHPLVIEHHVRRLCPVYRCARGSGSNSNGSGSTSRPCGMHSPIVSCQQCSKRLCSSHSMMLHVCGMGKPLQDGELASLTLVAGCEPLLPDGRCFLCRSAKGEVHTCRSILWCLMAVDHSQLPHANPAEDPRVLFQEALLQVRRLCHIIVQVVFM